MSKLNATDKRYIDAAVATGNAPRNVKGGRGLILNVPGARYKTIVDAQGKTTAFGKYYYTKVDTPTPNRGFDYGQDAIRVGNKETIKLLDGSAAIARIWNPRKGEFTFTKTGTEYYKNHSDRWLIQFPAKVYLRRKNGSYYTREEYLASSALGALGEINLPSTTKKAQQKSEVRQQAESFLANARRVSVPIAPDAGPGEIVLLAGYETWLYDPDRPILYDQQETFVAPSGQVSVQATLDRPLFHGKPWTFPGLYRPEGIAPEAFEDTDGACVPYQLHKLVKYKGKQLWSMEQVEEFLHEIATELYPDQDLQDLLGDHGCTARMILELCKQHNISVHILWDTILIEAYVPEKMDHHVQSLALTIHADHAYFYADRKTKDLIAKLPLQLPKTKPDTKVSIVNREKTPDASEWHALGSTANLDDLEAQTHYYAACLDEMRKRLHDECICPYVTLSGPTTINALYLPKVGKQAGPVIHLGRPEFHVCLEFCKKFSHATGRTLTYRGESLGVIGAKAFEVLTLGNKRKQISEEERERIKERQGGVCARCDGPCHDVDHKVALSAFGKDESENYQYLCVDCHTLKTYQERISRVEDTNLLLSRFSRETYEAFVKSAKPPQLCCNAHNPAPGTEHVWNVDIKRCRRNGLAENVVDLPIYAPTDEIKPATLGILADYNWVESTCRSPLLSLPYFGPGWYSKASCAFMLDHQIIALDDIKLAFDATSKIEARFLTKWMDTLESLWTDATYETAFVPKLCINAMLGIWSSNSHYSYNMCTTSEPGDVCFAGSVAIRKTPSNGIDDHMNDYIFKVEQLKLSSMRPIHQICLEAERINVARALYVIKHHCNPLKQQILSIQVDGVYFQPGKRVAQKIENDLANMTYGDLPGLRQKYEAASGSGSRKKAEPDLPRLRQKTLTNKVLQYPQAPSNSKRLVYNVEEIQVKEHEGGWHQCENHFVGKSIMPGGKLEFKDAPRPIVSDMEWTIIHESNQHGFYKEYIKPHIIDGGKSACIVGPPGTGKSWVLQEIAKELREKGEIVKIISLTHVAARNVMGQTAHSFIHRNVLHGRYKGWLLIDEISMMCLPLLAALETLSLSGCKILCFGDYDQLPPINNSWRGSSVEPKMYQNSRLLKIWCDSTMFVLTQCRRSDPEHFCWYITIPRMNLDEAKTSARAKLCENHRGENAQWNLVISHFRRIQINDFLQREATAQYKQINGNTKVLKIKPIDNTKEDGRQLMRNVPQVFEIWPGTRLIGADNENKKIVNGALFEVLDITDKALLVLDMETKEKFELKLEQVAKHTRLRWAVTYPAVQGRTLDGTVRLWDLDSKHMTLEALYIGVSRARHGSLVSISNDCLL